jgi:hypothetical protein
MSDQPTKSDDQFMIVLSELRLLLHSSKSACFDSVVRLPRFEFTASPPPSPSLDRSLWPQQGTMELHVRERAVIKGTISIKVYSRKVATPGLSLSNFISDPTLHRKKSTPHRRLT